jgi:uncharacterized protein
MIYAAIMLGLLGSMHCVGMCGPIALALPSGDSLNKFVFNRLLYNTGRVITYVFLGSLLGLAGGMFTWLGWQQWLAMSLGMLMLIFAIFSFRLYYNFSVPPFMAKYLAFIKSKLVRLFKLKGPMPALVTGVLNGLIPCGLVYLAMASALAAGNAFDGAIFMALFGLGTIPALLATAFAGRVAGLKWRSKFFKFSPVLMGILAIVIFLRGYFIEVPQTEPGIGLFIQETICGKHYLNLDN